MNPLRYFSPLGLFAVLWLPIIAFLVLFTTSVTRGDTLVFTDPPFEVIEDVTIRSIEGRGSRCLVTIKQGGFAGNMAWVDDCRSTGYDGPMRWTLLYE